MSKWSGKSKGGYLGYKIFILTIKYLGLKFAYGLLRLVTLYYLLFADKRALTFFYRRVLNYSKFKSILSIYRNFCMLGEVLVDKIAVMTGIKTEFTFDFEGEQFIRDIVSQGRGGLLLGAHMGNWEIGGQLLDRVDVRVNVVMYDGEHQQLKELFDKEFIDKSFNIIVIKDGLDHIQLILDAFRRNELVVMHGDRFVSDRGAISMNFMGEEAMFSASPLYMASRYGVPVSYVYTLKDSSSHYHFYATEPKIYRAPRSVKSREEV